MTNGIIVRLAGINPPITKIFHQEGIAIGTAADCDVVLATDGPALPPDSALITIRLKSGHYRITSFDAMAGITRDGEGIAVGETIRDGDTFYFAATGIRLRFFSLSDETDITDSLRLGSAVLAEAQSGAVATVTSGAPARRRRTGVPRTDVALVFVKQLLRELVAEIPRRTLYAIISLIVFVFLVLVYFNLLGFLEGRRNNQSIQELKHSIGQTHDELDKIRKELEITRQDAASVRTSLSLPETIVTTYGQGVCLLYGVYTFIDPRAGREVRFKEPGTTDNPIGPDGTLNLSIDGNGRAYEVEFTGTGFLVKQNLILTNRHVVQPWEEDDLASLIKMRGFRPRLKELFSYFPQTPQPFKALPIEIATEQDLALCQIEQGTAQLPVLPLDETSDGVASGQQVVLLGYPLGLEGLRARVDDISRTTSRRYGNLAYRTQLNELAASSKIRPQSTQGHISDVSPQLVYDARTDEGGSGGPVFGATGKVIGVNQAILLNSQSTTNFGVPIRYGIELIKKHQAVLAAQANPTGTNNQAKQ